MMLKKKSKVKLGGAVFLALLFCISYVGISFYSIPEKVSAVTWFPQEETRTLADIEYLQEMNKIICDNSAIGEHNTVLDIRDNNDYTIGKLADGKCWMTQNLRTTRESIKAKDLSNTNGTITSANSNVSVNYNIPASTDDKFANTDAANQQVHASANRNYGAYYSWCAATANTCTELISGAVKNADASSSICPKGWRLPRSGAGTDNEFAKVAGINVNISAGTDYWGNAITPSFSGGALTVNNVTWPAAGLAISAGLAHQGEYGRYWSSTAHDTGFAYNFYFSSKKIYPANGDMRYAGLPIRCIADEKILESDNPSSSSWRDTSSGSIAVKVANTLSIDAVSGMEEEVDSTKVSNGTITATIAANTNYKVLLSAEKTSLTSTNTTNTAEIPASATVQAGTNAWGIRNADNSTYSAITNQEKEYYNTTTLSTNPTIPGTVHTFNIGISVSPSLPADTYSTEVTITAAAA